MTASEQRAGAEGHELFVSCLPLIENVVSIISRRHHLPRPEAEDFGSIVKLKLLDDDSAVLRKFRNESSLKTFLVVVVSRLFLDYRTAAWGKWRPSSEARRAGPTAVLLERLLVRDRLPYSEACSTLRITHGVVAEQADLDRLCERLPVRTVRRMVDDSELAEFPGTTDLERETALKETSESHHRIAAALTEAIRRLPSEDRLLLRLRFDQGLTVSGIARATGVPQRRLYTRMSNLLQDLRSALEHQGFERASVLDSLEDIESQPVFWTNPGDLESRPSSDQQRRDGREVADRG